VEPALVREAQAAPAAEARDRRLIGPVDREPDLARRRVLFLQDRGVGLGSGEQVAVEAGEIAVEPLLADDRRDAVDGRDLGGADLACGVHAAGLDQDVVIVVELGGEVAGGARRHAAADRAAVEHDDAAAGARQLIGDR
jgi:hypothetical protein